MSSPVNPEAAVAEELERSLARIAELDRERAKQEGANWAFQFEVRGCRQQVERLASTLAEARAECDRLGRLNGQLQTQLRMERENFKNFMQELDRIREDLKHVHDRIDGVHGRVDKVESGVKGIYGSRIWKTLVAISSPLQKKPSSEK